MAFLDETGLAELWSLISKKYGVGFLHWWRKRTNSSGYYEKFSSTYARSYDAWDFIGQNLFISNSVKPASTGGLYMVDATRINIRHGTAATAVAASLAGKYVCMETVNQPSNSTLLSSVYYVYPDTTVTTEYIYDDDVDGTRYTIKKMATVTTEFRDVIGDWEYLSADNANAYPSGITNGIEYEYLGTPFDNARTPTRIQTGTYAGTGTYGQNNVNSLTFNFVPRFLMITKYADGLSGQNTLKVFFDCAIPFQSSPAVVGNLQMATSSWYGSSGGGWVCYVCTLNGKTFSWYNKTEAEYQLNASGAKYSYIAIG